MLINYCLNRPLFIFLLFISSISCSSLSASGVTDSFSSQDFQNLIGTQYPINYVTKHNDLGTLISIEYQFKKTRPDQHYIIQIQFSKSGTMLIESDYIEQHKNSLSVKSAEQHSLSFPSVGYRAQYTFLGAGPGGMAEQLIFTSSNKKHDIKIISSHLLGHDIEPIPLSLMDFANYVNSVLLNIK